MRPQESSLLASIKEEFLVVFAVSSDPAVYAQLR